MPLNTNSNYDELLKKLTAYAPNQGPSGNMTGGVGGMTPPTASPSSRISEFLQSPAGAATIAGGLGIAGGIANNRANAADSAAGRQQQLQMALGQTSDAIRSDNLSRDQSALNSTQLNPVKQQQDLFRASIMKTMAEHGAPQAQRGSVTPAPNFSGSGRFLGDDALAGAASRFYGAAGSMSNTAPPADLSSMGFKTDTSGLQAGMNKGIQDARDSRTALNTQQRNDFAGAMEANTAADVEQHKAAKDDDWLEKNSPAPQGYHWHDGELSEDGSGFWHKLAKYGGIAGAGVATAMTGGAASPLLMAAIGAGSGAAAGWGSGGGVKGTLLGAGLGAIPGVGGAMGKGAAQAATQIGGRTAMDIAKQVMTNPTVMGGIAGSALGPAAGTGTAAGLDYFNRRSSR